MRYRIKNRGLAAGRNPALSGHAELPMYEA
jgi:hypothetical protein